MSQDGQPTGFDYDTGDAGGLNEYNSDAAAVGAVQKQNNQNDPKTASFLIGHGLLESNPECITPGYAQSG